MLWTLSLANYYLYFITCFFRVFFFPVYSLEQILLCSHFCLTFSDFVKLDETVTYPGLEGVALSEASLWSLYVSSGLGGRAESEIIIGYIFPLCAGGRWGWKCRSWNQSQVWAGVFPMLCGYHHPIKSKFGFQAVTAKTLRIRSELALFPLSMKQWHNVNPVQAWKRNAMPECN